MIDAAEEKLMEEQRENERLREEQRLKEEEEKDQGSESDVKIVSPTPSTSKKSSTKKSRRSKRTPRPALTAQEEAETSKDEKMDTDELNRLAGYGTKVERKTLIVPELVEAVKSTLGLPRKSEGESKSHQEFSEETAAISSKSTPKPKTPKPRRPKGKTPQQRQDEKHAKGPSRNPGMADSSDSGGEEGAPSSFVGHVELQMEVDMPKAEESAVKAVEADGDPMTLEEVIPYTEPGPKEAKWLSDFNERQIDIKLGRKTPAHGLLLDTMEQAKAADDEERLLKAQGILRNRRVAQYKSERESRIAKLGELPLWKLAKTLEPSSYQLRTKEKIVEHMNESIREIGTSWAPRGFRPAVVMVGSARHKLGINIDELDVTVVKKSDVDDEIVDVAETPTRTKKLLEALCKERNVNGYLQGKGKDGVIVAPSARVGSRIILAKRLNYTHQIIAWLGKTMPIDITEKLATFNQHFLIRGACKIVVCWALRHSIANFYKAPWSLSQVTMYFFVIRAAQVLKLVKPGTSLAPEDVLEEPTELTQEEEGKLANLLKATFEVMAGTAFESRRISLEQLELPPRTKVNPMPLMEIEFKKLNVKEPFNLAENINDKHFMKYLNWMAEDAGEQLNVKAVPGRIGLTEGGFLKQNWPKLNPEQILSDEGIKVLEKFAVERANPPKKETAAVKPAVVIVEV